MILLKNSLIFREIQIFDLFLELSEQIEAQ